MLNADTAPYFNTCPRCGAGGFECLKTHSYCVDCNYSPDLLSYHESSGDDLPIPPWAAKAYKQIQSNKKRKVIELVPQDKKPNHRKGKAA